MQRLSRRTVLPLFVGSDHVCNSEPRLHGSITTVALTALADAAMQREGFFLREMTNLWNFSTLAMRIGGTYDFGIVTSMLFQFWLLFDTSQSQI